MDDALSVPAQRDWDGIGGAGSINLNEHVNVRFLLVTHGGSLGRDEQWPRYPVHHVTAGVIVPGGRTLTILPGATVKFEPGARIIVSGKLDVQGTAQSRSCSLPFVMMNMEGTQMAIAVHLHRRAEAGKV